MIKQYCALIHRLEKHVYKASDLRVLQAQKIYWNTEITAIFQGESTTSPINSLLKDFAYGHQYFKKSMSDIIESCFASAPSYFFQNSSAFNSYCSSMSSLPLEMIYTLFFEEKLRPLKNKKEIFYHLGLLNKKVRIFQTLGWQEREQKYFFPDLSVIRKRTNQSKEREQGEDQDKDLIIAYLEKDILDHQKKLRHLLKKQSLPFYFKFLFSYYSYLFSTLQKRPKNVFEEYLELGFLGKGVAMLSSFSQ